MAHLNPCYQCGGQAEFILKTATKESVFVQCPQCKIQTQPIAESVDYAAKENAAGVWNRETPMAWKIWVQPKNIDESYSLSSKVLFGNVKYISLTPMNMSPPGTSSWQLYREG